MVEKRVCRLSLLKCHGEEGGVKAVIAEKMVTMAGMSWLGTVRQTLFRARRPLKTRIPTP
jgi:hypothetical protein